jgi:glycosyltransferase involved in cell wall biosynthesis
MRSVQALRRLWGVSTLSANVAWVVRAARIRMGLRAPVPRPKLLQSCLAAPSAAQSQWSGGAQPVKVIVFSHNLNHEGASISLKELVVGLMEHAGLTAEVFSYRDGPLRAEYEAHRIPLKVLPPLMRTFTSVARLEEATSILASLIRESGAQVVLANTLLNFPAVLAAEEAGLPSVWNPRESEPWNRYFDFLPDAVAQRALAAMGLPRRVVFVASATREVWREFEQECSFTVVHNALNPARFSQWLSSDKLTTRRALGWGEGETVFLCTGTVCERKGQEDAIAALALINDRLDAPVRLVLVGDASRAYARRLKHQVSRWGQDGFARVDFIDATNDVGKFYLAADVFVLCSRVESYPRVILEALAFGLPIITTPVFGVTEQLPEPGDALFYKPGDSACLAEHLLHLATRRSARVSFSAQSRLAAGRMPSFEDMCRAYARILRSSVLA